MCHNFVGWKEKIRYLDCELVNRIATAGIVDGTYSYRGKESV